MCASLSTFDNDLGITRQTILSGGKSYCSFGVIWLYSVSIVLSIRWALRKSYPIGL